MTHPILAQALAEGYQRDVTAAARRSRLAVLATCCRPSRLRQLADSARARLAQASRRPQGCCA
ncbi:MAG TPA: hypothetical protein VGN28_06705 [Blastococcus sp.]|jgi:hypothetical protein|nr:hypothetical protein [Blastococcus sp.]